MMDPSLASTPPRLHNEADEEGEDDVLMEVSPSTSAHLQTLPPFLHPISPSLAALHMARMRLLCQIPPSASILSRWCNRCGGLREGNLGGPSRRRKSMLTTLSHRQIGRTESLMDLETVTGATTDVDIDTGMDVDGVAEQDSSSRSVPAKKKKAECNHCGQPFTRPKPDRSTLSIFVSARKTRAVRKAAEASSQLPSSTIPLAPTPGSIAPTALGLSLTGTLPPLAEGSKPRPTLLTTPSLAYIPKEDPNPPSYPQPPPSVAVKRAGSPDSGKSEKRKMKKSGLARLLAESKGREEQNLARGRWGLD